MKTAISIPDDLYKKAEKAAKKLGLSRSSIYSLAVQEYLKRLDPSHITEQLDAVYSQESFSIDKEIVKAQFQSIKREE